MSVYLDPGIGHIVRSRMAWAVACGYAVDEYRTGRTGPWGTRMFHGPTRFRKAARDQRRRA